MAARLKAFGLSTPEAVVYYHMSRLGPSLASEIGRASGVQRTDVYELLKAMEKKRVVEKTLERPSKFVPVPIETLLDHSVTTEADRLEHLRRERDDLVAAWPRGGSDLDKKGERYAVLQGAAQIAGLLDRVVASAKEDLILALTRRGLARIDVASLAQKLEARTRAGVWVRILTEVEAPGMDRLKGLAEHGHVRHIDLPGYYQVVIADTSNLAYFVSTGAMVSTSGVEETALWLNSPDFILGQKALFEVLWERGTDWADRIRELQGGAPAPRAEVIRGRWIRTDRMRALLRRAKKELLVLAPTSEVARWAKSGFAAALTARAKEGLHVRVVTPHADDALAPPIDVQNGPTGWPGVVFLVDGREAVVGTHADDAREEAAFEGEWGVWTSDAPLVAALVDLLSRDRPVPSQTQAADIDVDAGPLRR